MKKIIAVPLLLLVLISCSFPAGPTAIVETPVPTLTRANTQTPFLLSPTGTPQAQPTAEWNGIPIMPGAMAGEGDEEGYVFTIQATPAQVQEYYERELGKLGWQLASQEQGDSSLTLLFMNSASTTVTVSILTQGDQALVLLAK